MPLVAMAIFIAQAARPYELMVGDIAPKLGVSKWLRGQPVQTFERGKVYVIDFFATWCEPCKRSMPELSTMQTRFGSDVTFIGVDAWDYQERVPALLLQMGSKLNYRVALDDLPAIPKGEENIPMWAKDNGRMAKTWMIASGADGLPVAYIIDREGRVCWIGDDVNELKSTLEAVMAGTFDLAAASASYANHATHDKVVRTMEAELFKRRQAKDWAGAIEYCDKLMAFEPALERYASRKFQILLGPLKKKDQAYKFATDQIASANPSVQAFAEMSAEILEVKTPKTNADFDLADRLANHANELAKGENSDALSALAEVAFAKGDKESAIRWQRLAIAKTTDQDELAARQKRLVIFGG